MDETNMTLGDFIEYAEVYPYSQDRYYIEKSMMELRLLELHLESYNFILQNNVSLDQLDVLMVESGANDMSVVTEELYMEKVNSIINGINKILNMVKKALKTLFHKSKKIFDTALKDDGVKMKVIEDLANNINNNKITKNNITEDIREEILGILSNFEKEYHSFSIEKGSKILVSSGISKDNPVFIILNFAANASGGISKNTCGCMAKLSSGKEYDVTGPRILNDYEKIVDLIINLPKDTDNKDQILSKLNELNKELKVSIKSNASFKIPNNEEWQSKIDATNKLNILNDIINKYNENSMSNSSSVISKLNEIVTDLQTTSSNMVFAITNHVNIRKKAIEDRNKIIKILNNIKTDEN